jgi:hypothetical protein
MALSLSGCSTLSEVQEPTFASPEHSLDGNLEAVASSTAAPQSISPQNAEEVLATLLLIKGRAPKTGICPERIRFGLDGYQGCVLWGGNSFETRQDILSRDLTDITCKAARDQAKRGR